MLHTNLIDHAGSPPLAKPSRLATISLCSVIFVLGYTFSVWLLDLYRGGDQEHYANFWHALQWSHPSQWSRLQVQYLSSTEPLYRFIIGLGTYYDFERINYLSLWNAVLLTAIGYALLKYRCSLVFALLVFTNYYVFVLVGPAERLKFAYLMLVLAVCVDNVKIKTFLSALSIFAHSQAVVQFISSAVYYVSTHKQQIFSSRLRTLAFIIGAPILLAAGTYLIINNSGEVISQKADYYGETSQGVLEIIQWLLILACGMIVFDKKLQFIVGMVPMGVLTALYGGRINVATLAFFCALALSQRKTTHPLILAVMGYMSFKTIGFVTNVLGTGQGFS